MKILKIMLMLILSSYILIGCSYASSKNQLPNSILKNDVNADFFIMDSLVFINAENVEWVENLELEKGELLGKINKTNVKRNFEDWDATQLNKDTPIYKVNGRNDLVLIKLEDKYIPYIKYIEG